ncbi:hypothetical protein MUP32_04620 [Candidatus Microgenomates bacterium]|nr:hypothetical protein [Candidatus Microgenomates bacterium]
MVNQIRTCFIECNLLDKFPSLILAILPIGFSLLFIWYVINVFRKADDIEENIFIVKDWIDNLEYIIYSQKGPYFSQSMLDKIVGKERKPLEAELDRLKMERQFLLDKVPLLGMLRK